MLQTSVIIELSALMHGQMSPTSYLTIKYMMETSTLFPLSPGEVLFE